MFGIKWNAIYRAYLLTLRGIIVTHTFRALGRIDDVDFLALGDGLVGALRFTHVAIDALVGNKQSHGCFFLSQLSSCCRPQALFDTRLYKFSHIATQSCDFTHHGGRDEHVLLSRCQKHGFDLGIEAAVHSGHLEFVLEVRYGAQAAQDALLDWVYAGK
mgnify:CR=1 FL=1